MNTNKKRFSGVTFIEILIGLTIFSIVSTSLYSTFFSGTSTWKRSEDFNRLYQEARWSLDTIAKELHNAIIFTYKDSYPNFKVFDGQTNSLSFLIEDEYGIKRITYFLESQENGAEIPVFSLKRQETSLIDSLQISAEDKTTEVFSSLVAKEGLKFRYPFIVSGSQDEDIEWRDSWQDSDSLPEGVVVELILQNPRNPNTKLTFHKTVFIPMGIIGGSQETEQ